MLQKEKQVKHDYHNEKIEKWLIENHIPRNRMGGEFGCSCDVYIRLQDLDKSFITLSNGKEKEYIAFFDKYSSDFLIRHVPGLTADEEQELGDIKNIRVYFCPHCLEWALDGDEL